MKFIILTLFGLVPLFCTEPDIENIRQEVAEIINDFNEER